MHKKVRNFTQCYNEDQIKKYTQLEPSAPGLAESWKRERRYPDALFKKGGLSYGSGDNSLDTRRKLGFGLKA